MSVCYPFSYCDDCRWKVGVVQVLTPATWQVIQDAAAREHVVLPAKANIEVVWLRIQ